MSTRTDPRISTKNERPWQVAINGTEHEEPFTTEQDANDFAASRRGNRLDTKAPDMSKKIAVYQRGSDRHAKAIVSGAAPDPRERDEEPARARASAPKQTKPEDEKKTDPDPKNS